MLFHPIYQNLFQSSKTKIGNPVDEDRNALFFSKKNKKKRLSIDKRFSFCERLYLV